jgi:roadblock/LC7 domain-containing protein
MPWRWPWAASVLTWTPVHGWAASGGIYSIAVHGDRFVVVETGKVGSFDELRRLLQAGKP